MQQSINARGVDEKLASYFGMVIVDECYLPGAQVRMADGSYRAIEDVGVGEEVAVGGRVLATMRRHHEGELYRLGSAVCTGGHPVATTRGWLNVSEISDSDDVWCLYEQDERSEVYVVRAQHEGGGAPGPCTSECKES